MGISTLILNLEENFLATEVCLSIHAHPDMQRGCKHRWLSSHSRLKKNNAAHKTDRWRESKRNVTELFLKIDLIRFVWEIDPRRCYNTFSHFLSSEQCTSATFWKGGNQQESTILGFVSWMDLAFSLVNSCIMSLQWATFPETLQMWGQYFSTTFRLIFMETGQTKGLKCINVITRLCL